MHRQQQVLTMISSALAKVNILIASIPLLAFAICIALILALQPLLMRYALARPNARSSHTTPTPQGGGVAVIIATICAFVFSTTLLAISLDISLHVLLTATISLAIVGAYDDLRPIPALPRIFLQSIAIGAVLASLPVELRLLPSSPLWFERAALLICGVWYVNLVNFMDGLDWMTAAEIIPITVTLGLFGVLNELPLYATLIAIALGGAMIGFTPFNRPVAKLFLGDVGSLPIGLLTGWCLLHLAYQQHLVAALLLPLYYLADATITLIRRFLNGDKIWMAHRTHFYQRATDNGLSVLKVVSVVLVLNIVLAILAIISVAMKSTAIDILSLCIGVSAVALVLNHFSRKHITT